MRRRKIAGGGQRERKSSVDSKLSPSSILMLVRTKPMLWLLHYKSCVISPNNIPTKTHYIPDRTDKLWTLCPPSIPCLSLCLDRCSFFFFLRNAFLTSGNCPCLLKHDMCFSLLGKSSHTTHNTCLIAPSNLSTLACFPTGMIDNSITTIGALQDFVSPNKLQLLRGRVPYLCSLSCP